MPYYTQTNIVANYKGEPFLLLYGDEIELRGKVFDIQVVYFKGVLLKIHEDDLKHLVKCEKKK